jgi:hypothetical protein
MSTGITMDSGGRFGTAFAQALDKNGMTLVDFAKVIDGSYENLRKVYKGLSLPGKFIVDQAVKNLKMNKDEAEKLIAQDRMEKKVGKKAMQSVFGRHPRSGDFDAVTPHLTEEQIDGILVQMRAMMASNRRKGR